MKFIKKLIITIVITFAFLGAGVTAMASAGYIQWNGSSAKDHMLVTFENIKQNISTLKSENNSNKQTVNDLKQQVKDKEQTIKDKEQAIKDKQQEVDDKNKVIADKQKEIDEIKKNQTAGNDQLKQAETDIKMLDKEADKLLEASKQE